MKPRPVRLTVLALMILVALCALGLGGYRAYERRRECLVRAREHEEYAQDYRKDVGFYTRMARMEEESAESSMRAARRFVAPSNAFLNDLAKEDRTRAARNRTNALRSGHYAQFHVRMKNRYLDAARHPWRALPRDSAIGDDELVASLEAIVRQEPSNGETHEKLGDLWVQKGGYAQALAEYELAIKNNDELINAHNDSAWILATCLDARLRNGQKAIALATRACELTKWKEPSELDTLAAAYAEAGQFDAAVAWQTKAIELLEKSSEDRDAYTKRLRLYEAKQPFRQ